MIIFIQPIKLNGAELRAELNASGVVISDAPNAVSVDASGNLWLEIANKDKAKAEPIVAAHNGTTVAPDTSAAKAALLARLGITADEAKLLLG
jgi:hypothetical protein